MACMYCTANIRHCRSHTIHLDAVSTDLQYTVLVFSLGLSLVWELFCCDHSVHNGIVNVYCTDCVGGLLCNHFTFLSYLGSPCLLRKFGLIAGTAKLSLLGDCFTVSYIDKQLHALPGKICSRQSDLLFTWHRAFV